MSGVRRATIYKLASTAHEAELDVMSGIVRQDENGPVTGLAGMTSKAGSLPTRVKKW